MVRFVPQSNSTNADIQKSGTEKNMLQPFFMVADSFGFQNFLGWVEEKTPNSSGS
jgi:hypothetical protein